MKTKVAVIIPSLILLLVMSFNLSGQSAKEIMKKYNDVHEQSYFSSIRKTKMSTSKYTIRNNKMVATEKPRVVVIEVVLKDFGKDNEETRFISTVNEPIRDKGISMLTYHYAAPDIDDDNWLYLPALGKVKRIVSSNNNVDESASYFGTEFSIEDLSTRKINDYTYKLLEQTTFENNPVSVLELTPTEERAKKSMYSKVKLWIDTERQIIVRQDLYDHTGLLIKRITSSNIVKIDNVWVAKKAQMNNLITRRVTLVNLLSGAYNIEVPDDFLTQRTLTDFAYREKNLTQLRTNLK